MLKINPKEFKKLIEVYENISSEVLEEIWGSIMNALAQALPFIWWIGRKLTVIYDPYFLEAPAAVDSQGRLIFGPLFLHISPSRDKVVIIAHEVLHVALQHPWRVESYIENRKAEYPPQALSKAYNIASDGIVNELLKECKILLTDELQLDDFTHGDLKIEFNEYLIPLWQLLTNIPIVNKDMFKRFKLVTFETISKSFKIEPSKLGLDKTCEEVADEILKKMKFFKMSCPIAAMLREIEEMKKKLREGKSCEGEGKGEKEKKKAKEGGSGKEKEDEGDFSDKDLEELEKKLREFCKKCRCGHGGGKGSDDVCPYASSSDVLSDYKPSDKAKTIQKGEIERRLKEGEKFDKVIRDVVREAYVVQKTIGTVPAGLLRVIEQLLESKIPWRLLLRSFLTIAEGSNATIMWHIENPVYGTVPNYLHLGVRTILWLVDTSGSISKYELEQIASEIQACNRHAEVIVIPWDATAYEPIICKKPTECIKKLKIKMYGGGGTVIKPALEKAVKIALRKRPQMIIIASDGHIFDLVEDKDSETIKLLTQLRSLCRKMLFITTDVVPEPIKKLKIDIIEIPIRKTNV